MITIITGNINTRKTTKTIEHYERNHQGDGFVSLKLMTNDSVDHYEMIKLSTQEKKILMIHKQSILIDKFMSLDIGPYHVLKQTVLWVEEEIKQMIKMNVSPIYLDEIGVLELKNEGFHHILITLLEANLDLVLVVRDGLRQEVISKYHMKNICLL